MNQGMKALVLGLALSAPFAVAGNGTTAEHIEAATAAYKQVAKDTGYQWTVTVKAIKAAQKALKEGDDAGARKLAHQAMDLVEATRMQAKIESETWQMRVPK
jgi:isopentenyl diphosphate isomerase/L-lactate dehydrogenase-like FMN-dependent dehydrogenase